MEINQGDIYWVRLEASGSAPGIAHPQVVVQDNALNRSRIRSLVVCSLTTNARRANSPGNVVLEAGEAQLPKQSIVVVSQVSTIDQSQLGEYIGTLSPERVSQILAGIRFLHRMTERP